jgi:hypothetical protein
MSTPREPDPSPARVHKGWRGAASAALALAMVATAAEGKVIWDGATPLVLHPRDGARELCRSQPLLRAERLARREAIIVQPSGAPLMPYPLVPYPLVLPALRTEWMWPDHRAGVAAAPMRDRMTVISASFPKGGSYAMRLDLCRDGRQRSRA